MKRYIALLRGVNVGGKNKIAMAELKSMFEELGFTDVLTHLNSGNVVFSDSTEDTEYLAHTIKMMIENNFKLEIPVFIISQNELKEILNHAPDWWGDSNKEIYDNLIFIFPHLSYDKFYHEIGKIKHEYEKVCHYGNAVFWSFNRKSYQKTNWWRKTSNSSISNDITIRTANTVRKLIKM